MLDLNNSWLRTDASRSRELASTAINIEEGQLLKLIMENGVAKVVPTEGNSGETVDGFAMSRAGTPTRLRAVETITVPADAPYTVTLGKSPDAGGISARFVDTGAALTAGTVATGVYSISGRTMTFHSSDAGKTIRVVYGYAPTLAEAQVAYGENIYAMPLGPTDVVGVVFGADLLLISNFDITSNWWAANPGPVYSGPNGTVTLTNTGTLIPGVKVTQAPGGGIGDQFLGLTVRL